MGRPIHTHNTIIRSVQVSKVQNTEQQRDETKRRQFAMTLQEEAAHKEKQVQDSHKSEAPTIRKEPESKEKRKKSKKRSRKDLAEDQQNSSEKQKHIDLKID